MAIYEYNATKTFTAALEVDDPGNCAICAHGYYQIAPGIKMPGDYYMIFKTIMGQTTLLKWGPVTGMPDLPGGYSVSVTEFKYKESTIDRNIKLMLNDGLKFIYEAAEVKEDEAFAHLPKDYNFAATLERAE